LNRKRDVFEKRRYGVRHLEGAVVSISRGNEAGIFGAFA